MDNFEDFIRKFVKAYQDHTLSVRYCQRCEEPRLNVYFEDGAPVCASCLETMPESELRWLAYEYKDR
jgi:formylmethanofuran dehydrogenase subunit E